MMAYFMENHPMLPTMERQDFDEDSFAFIIIIIVIVGGSTWKKNESYMRNKYPEQIESGDKSIVSSEQSSHVSSTGRSVGSGFNKMNSSNVTGGNFEDINLQKDTAKRRRGASGNSIGSTELVSLLERDFSTKSISKGNEESSMLSGSVRSEQSEDDSTDDGLLEDIITSDNESQSLKSKELFEYQMDSVPTISSKPDNDILNVHQTLELKGILTLCFLIYESTNASKAHEGQHHGIGLDGPFGQKVLFNPYHNLAKISTTAFLFMTGFGHTMYFYRQDDYSIRRVLKVLFRVNFAAMFLCLALDKPYIFYKPCAIHTYFFSYIYGTMKWRNKKNYTNFGLRLKIIVMALGLYLVWDCDIGLWQIHAVVFGRSQYPIAGAQYGQLWEFYFQGHLHHWAALVGMIYAFNHPISSLTIRRLEKLGNPVEAMFKGIVFCTITVAMTMWYLGPFHTTKYLYNATNAYFGFLPVLWYVFARNATESLRSHHCELFKTIGQYSLEIYLLHHHFFHTDESGSKLMILPGYPACNLVLILALLISASKVLKAVTCVITSMLLNTSSDTKAIWNSLAFCGCLGILHATSIILDYLGMCNPHIVATATIICGMLLYQATMDIASASSRKKGKQAAYNEKIFIKESLASKSVPGVIGTLSVLILCAVWYTVSVRGASSALTRSPPFCGDVVNHGKWTKVPGCSEYQKGINRRDYKSRSKGKLCEDVYQWGWTLSDLNPLCHFRFHEPSDSKAKLQHKNVVFMGDTVTRSVYLAFCRALGETSLPGSNGSEIPPNSDITKSYGETNISFQWAPLTSDILDKLKAVRPETDLVVAGSGGIDRLHLWATDADRNSYEVTMKQLAKDLEFLKSKSAHVVWITPTAISTNALPTEDQRLQMSESNVQEIRTMQKDFGINSAAAFVLDGLALTKEQVHRSYDGVHYPSQIYDVGAQILINALDWLLPIETMTYQSNRPFKPILGSMANPALGLMVICCILIGLLFFDGYLGFSYLALSLIQPKASPSPGKVALFYSSKDVETQQSFGPQDLYDEVCKVYERRPKRRRSKIPKSELPTSRNSNHSSGSRASKSSNNSRSVFGLSTITEN